eukprot:Blabericola_migrator_1__805@NODE_11_length_24785_cov_110_100736_g8_i0_p8_GENE_NODE_11_length_24785_cov_110_100736_g8_i0NODE_11_length_24785_cov_110_100736_g8_i0_p8_ORF_typecomplete_len441_score69_61Glyco_transf_25/PF01755_17/0_15_NODE_11_length_24785_cov_110_100736_g8_i02140322725
MEGWLPSPVRKYIYRIRYVDQGTQSFPLYLHPLFIGGGLFLTLVAFSYVVVQGVVTYMAAPTFPIEGSGIFWLDHSTKVKSLNKIVAQFKAGETESKLPPMITGMFKTEYPMFFVADEAFKIKQGLMEFGFDGCGVLEAVSYLSVSDSEEKIATTVRTSKEELKRILQNTTKRQYVEYMNYLAALKAAYDTGAAVATVMYDDVSPAVSVYWDADYDEYVKLAQRTLPNWLTIVTAYHYPADTFTKKLDTWKDDIVHSRLIPVNADFVNVSAAIWSQKGLATVLGEHKIHLDHKGFGSMPSTCAEPSCRFDKLLKSYQELSVGSYLIQPPLFGYRPFPEGVHKTLKDPQMKELHQAIVDTFRWSMENSEVYDNLHAYVSLPPATQELVYDQALAIYKHHLQYQNMTEAEIEADIKTRNAPFLLAYRLQSFVPRHVWWVPVE